ncbi:MAG: hypothetical protein EA001_15875 [Oscillatoriales cyanobacterium]|nr:MAG: hypothetical protein EA001_15875 [Oscillatoriales cyanobacterium]
MAIGAIARQIWMSNPVASYFGTLMLAIATGWATSPLGKLDPARNNRKAFGNSRKRPAPLVLLI